MDPIDELRQLEDKITERLKSNPDFIALLAVQRAIRDIVNSENSAQTIRGTVTFRRRLPNTAATSLSASKSQADASYEILSRHSDPLQISDLVRLVRESGTSVGGSNPEMNLSSSLSRDERFFSTRYAGRQCWAIKNKNYDIQTK